ncbi:thioredoxin domain-containing protein [Synechococcus sp. YX-04-1]|uniref:DsbA family protein n=1 Tax=Synechococcus sp. YX-04-1 TaxID=3062778 RepID=UPI0026E40045|nr:thioredoxin domain-containing protein [Synechococcus sp. YX-04-1]MDO6351454.1 thioredoxin domain-containing protein [Synechococcus sp. YX-04-1]
MLGFLTGVALGIGSTVVVQGVQERGLTPPSKPQARPSPALTSPLLLKGEPALGNASAPLTFVEFSDFECSYCRRFHEQVFPKLKSQYIDTGLVRFVHKDLPLPIHPQALPAAAAARCAGEQNRYWDMYSALFNQQNCLSCKGVLTIATEEQLDTPALQSCMERKATVAVINANRSEASLHNINATPTFVIGPTQSNGSLDGKIIEGALPWSTFKSSIDAALRDLSRN